MGIKALPLLFKSNKPSFLVILICLTCSLKGQNWFPVGASWTYNQVILFEGNTSVSFEVTRDEMINGKLCKELTGQCTCSPVNATYVYEEEGRVYRYDQELDSFFLLYDFNLVAGDTLVISAGSLFNDQGQYIIDSVSTVNYNGEELRVQHITTLNWHVTLGSKLIEKIGSNECFFPQIGFCDPGTGGIICYEDQNLGLVHFQPGLPCNMVSTLEENNSNSGIVTITPNPVVDRIKIQPHLPIKTINLMDSSGKQIVQMKTSAQDEYTMDVSGLVQGIYYLQVIAQNGSDQVIKIAILN